MKNYYYRVYGLEIESEIKVEEFLEINKILNENEKVEFKYGKIGMDILEELKSGKFIFNSKNDIYLYIENIATYYISNGNKVIIDVCKDADEKMVNIYLLGSVLGILMLQRGKVAIHGATITKNNKGIILTGDRGAGKSTLTTALRLNGYNFLSDDVASISFTNKPLIKHGFPYQKLCEDAVNNMNYDKNKLKSFLADDKVKYLLSVKDEFVTDDIELFAMVEITVEDIEEVKIEKVTGHAKLAKVLENIYRKEYINACGGMSKEYFKTCVGIAKHIDVYKIIRPHGKFTVDEQIKLIEEQIKF